MTHHVPLPPELEAFVRLQLTAGRYRSEDEVVLAALRLLAGQSPSPGSRPIPADAPPARPTRRSPRGLLADLRSGIDPDEIHEARREMWAGFLHGGAE